ncbi:MAG: ribonuclease HIII [Planctomycetota bacterium JB042]
MHVQIVSTEVAGAVRDLLEGDGFRMGSAPYAEWEAVGSDVRATFYGKRRKLLIQGQGTGGLLRRLAGVLPATEPAPERTEARVDGPTIGTDEAGKGDYFGSLAVAGCLVGPDDVEWLRAAGVKDSKLLSDASIEIQEGKILSRIPTEVVELAPPEYGEAHRETRNVNVILGRAHAEVIRRLLARGDGVKRIVVDRFGSNHHVLKPLGKVPKGTEMLLVPRAESNPAVAAASVVARATFVRSLRRLSDACGVDLLPGASAEVERVARKVAAVGGRALLGTVAKLHFKTTERVLADGA